MLMNWCFWIVVLEKTLESPLDSEDIKPVNPKENQPWIFTGKMLLKLQYFGHLMWRANSLEKTLKLGKTCKRRRGWQRTNPVDMSLNKLQEIVKHRQAWHPVVYGTAELDKTQQLNNNWCSLSWKPSPFRP